jgi:ABC-type amino acid transport substrate-binding protein
MERTQNMQRALKAGRRGLRVGTAALAVALLAAALPPLADAAPATLERVRAEGRITLGYRADARPFSYQDESGKPAGYSIELCRRLADDVKTELGLAALAVEWVPLALEERFSAVQQGRVDLLCAADTASLSRMKEVSFSLPVFPGGVGVLLRTDAPPGLREVLSGRPASGPIWRGNPAQVVNAKTFSVVTGTTSERWLASRIDTLRLTATVVPVPDYDAGVQRVLNRTSSGFFGERAIILDAARRGPSARNLVVLDRQFTFEPIALAFQRGDEDFRVVVDGSLSRLFAAKEFEDLYAKWFGRADQDTRTFFRWSVRPE